MTRTTKTSTSITPGASATSTAENPALLRRSHYGRAVGLAAVAALALTACGSDDGDGGDSADAEDVGDLDTEFLTLATGGSSGVYYQVGATFSDLLADELDSDTSVQATGASAENINMLTDGNAEIAFTMGDANVQALEGTGPFEDDARENLMAIAALYPNTCRSWPPPTPASNRWRTSRAAASPWAMSAPASSSTPRWSWTPMT